MNKILLIILLLMVLGLSYTYHTVTKEPSVSFNDEFLGPVETPKVGLYYNLDDESKVYVRNGEGKRYRLKVYEGGK